MGTRKSNQIALRIGLVIMVLATLLCSGFIYYTKLGSPVFLRYCMDVELPQPDGPSFSQPIFTLNYITNMTDQNSVNGITFPEAPEIQLIATENAYNTGMVYFNSSNQGLGSQYGRYSYRTIYLYPGFIDLEGWTGEKVVHKAELHLNNGDTLTVDMGTIVFYRDQENQDEYLGSLRSSSTSDGSSNMRYQVDPDIELVSVKSDLLDQAEGISYYRIDGYDYKEFPPQPYKNDGVLDIAMQFGSADNNAGNTYDYYNIGPKLYYRDPEGNIKYERIYCYPQEKYFRDYKEMLFYLNERGAF